METHTSDTKAYPFQAIKGIYSREASQHLSLWIHKVGVRVRIARKENTHLSKCQGEGQGERRA
jgi:hypothetical protein